MHLARVAIALVRPLARAISWVPLLAVTPIVPALAGLFGTIDDGLPPDLALVLLRADGLLLGAAAAYTLTDQMAASTAAVPSPRWLRQWTRTTLALTYAAAAWTGTYTIVTARSTSPLPQWDTTVEAAVCVTAGLAGAAFAVRRIPESHAAATAGAATLFTLLAASLFLPADWSPWPGPGTPHWDTAHTGWLLAIPLTLTALAIAHRDTRTT
jgi:hypothetical protein